MQLKEQLQYILNFHKKSNAPVHSISTVCFRMDSVILISILKLGTKSTSNIEIKRIWIYEAADNFTRLIQSPSLMDERLDI